MKRKKNPKKSDRHICTKTLKEKVDFIKLLKHIYPIKMICKVLHLNRSTVYKILKNQMSDRDIRRLELESKNIKIHNEFDSIYSVPKIRGELIK